MKIFKTRNNKRNSNKKCISCNLELESSYKPSIKEVFLYNNISSLEKLLTIIKNFQISILTNIKKPNNKYVKTLLLKLIQNLNYLINEQNSEMIYLEKTISQKKITLQNQIFIDYKNDQPNNNISLEGKKSNIFNLNSELGLLQILNFKAENDIQQINNLMFKITNDYNYLNVYRKYLSIEEKENICINPKFYPFINLLLTKQLNEARQKFKIYEDAKKYQNEEIENTINEMTKFQNYLINKKLEYLNDKELIKEESNEFSKSLTLNKINENINEIISKYNKYKGEENKENYNDNIIIIETESKNDDEDSDSNNFNSSEFSSFSIIKKNKNIKNNNQPYANLNFNLNINFYKIYHFQENMKYNSERNNKNIITFLNNIKIKKGLSSTGSLPHLMINAIKDKSNPNSRNNKSKLNDINYIDKYNSNSNEILSKEYLMTI